MRKRLLGVASLCALVAVAAGANCSISLNLPAQVESGQSYELVINPSDGTYIFFITQFFTADAVSRTQSNVELFGPGEPMKIGNHFYRHRTTEDMEVYYVVSATNPSDQSDACTKAAKVLVKADPELRRVTARGIVPVVGSVEGLNGSKFRTEVKIAPSYDRGRLIFHPIGKPASDSDPSIAYGGPGHEKYSEVYPDIAAALGVTGLGSLDVVPENSRFTPPTVETRIYNIAEDGGTYGTLEPMVSPAEYLNLTPNTQAGPPDYGLGIPGPSSGFRLNVGVRSLASGMLRGTVRHQDGSFATGQVFVDGDQLVMGSPESLFGVAVAPGDTMGLEFASAGSSGILFYTVTDNRTNDPAIAVKLKEYRRSRNYAE